MFLFNYFLILLMVFHYGTVGTVISELNIGTTLFTRADLLKECWSSENIALLTSRMILEDVLPPTSTVTINSDQCIEAVIDYYRLILETVRGQTYGKTKYIILVSLADLLGGYLHYAILPTSKFAFYAGLVDRESVVNLLNLFEELKWFLRTNGQGWSERMQQYPENYELQRIPLHFTTKTNPCQNLIYDENKGKHSIQIQMPFFDNGIDPNSIALPLKHNPLHNLESNESSYIVMKFFVTCYQCLTVKNADWTSFREFEQNFNNWLETNVIPLLNNVKFYTAFGGILRIRETLRTMGNSNNFDKIIDNYEQMNGVNEGPINFKHNCQKPVKSSNLVLIIILSVILLWFLIGCLFICYKLRRRRNKSNRNQASSGSLVQKPSKTSSFSFLSHSEEANDNNNNINLTPSDPDPTTTDESGDLISLTEPRRQNDEVFNNRGYVSTNQSTRPVRQTNFHKTNQRKNHTKILHKFDENGALITTTTTPTDGVESNVTLPTAISTVLNENLLKRKRKQEILTTNPQTQTKSKNNDTIINLKENQIIELLPTENNKPVTANQQKLNENLENLLPTEKPNTSNQPKLPTIKKSDTKRDGASKCRLTNAECCSIIVDVYNRELSPPKRGLNPISERQSERITNQKSVQSKHSNTNDSREKVTAAHDRSQLYLNDKIPSKLQSFDNEKLEQIYYPNNESSFFSDLFKGNKNKMIDSLNSLNNDNAAVIETNHSVTNLPAINEVSESGSSKHSSMKLHKFTFCRGNDGETIYEVKLDAGCKCSGGSVNSENNGSGSMEI